MEVSVAAVLVLGGLVVLRWAFLMFGAALLLQAVRDCPACFRPTVSVRKRFLMPVRSLAEWRWCPACGWQGPTRRTPRPAE